MKPKTFFSAVHLAALVGLMGAVVTMRVDRCGDPVNLRAPVRVAILQHDRDHLRAELDATRHEVESAHATLGLLCKQPEKSDFPPAAVADEDPAIPSFKTDCAIVWSRLLDSTSGQVKLQRYGVARVVSWWPDYPGKRRKR